MRAFLVRHRYELALLATVIVWGVNVPVLKLALREVPAPLANALRFSIGALAIGLAAWREGRGQDAPLRTAARRYGGTLFGLGVLGYFLYQEAFVAGLPRTSAASGSLLMSTSPLWTALLSHATGAQRLRRAGWGGLALSLGGAGLVVVGAGHAAAGDTLVGNAIMLGAAVLWAVYTTFSRRLSGGVAPAAAAFLEMLCALPFLYAVAAPALGGFDPAAVRAGIWVALAFSGALSVGLTFVAWNASVAHVGPAATAAFGNVTPLAAAGAGVVLLGEPISAIQVLGGALLIGGLVWMRRGTRVPAEVPEEGEGVRA